MHKAAKVAGIALIVANVVFILAAYRSGKFTRGQIVETFLNPLF